jgi:hypothetical protein
MVFSEKTLKFIDPGFLTACYRLAKPRLTRAKYFAGVRCGCIFASSNEQITTQTNKNKTK